MHYIDNFLDLALRDGVTVASLCTEPHSGAGAWVRAMQRAENADQSPRERAANPNPTFPAGVLTVEPHVENKHGTGVMVHVGVWASTGG